MRCIYRVRQKSIHLKNFVNFSRTLERCDIKSTRWLLIQLSASMWKISLHYLQNWQNYAAFNHGNLAVETFSKIVSTIQDCENAVSANTFSVEINVFRHRSRTLVKLCKTLDSFIGPAENVPYLLQCKFLIRKLFWLRMKVS